MKVRVFRCNEFSENCYVVYDKETLDAIIIDPGMRYVQEWNLVKDYISENKLTIRHILLTHYHIDHIFGTELCRKEYGIPVSGSMLDMQGLPTPVQQAKMFGFDDLEPVAKIENNLVEGDRLKFGRHVIHVIDCPGHSHAGLCYYVEDAQAVFTGDVLFYSSIGRSDLGSAMGGNGELLVEGIRTKLLVLPTDTLVHPGHGPRTTIGQEIKNNPYI